MLGLDCITGLQTSRILAGHGVPVIGLVGDARHFAARTKACREVRATVLTDERLIDDLVRWGPALTGAVLVPCTDLTVQLVARNSERLAPFFRWSLPEADVVDLLVNKVSFAEHARAVGVSVPTTVVLRDRSAAVRATEVLNFPAVIKPPVKSPEWVRHTAEKAIVVADAPALLEVYDRVHHWAPELLAQDWIEGSDESLYSCNAYFGADGRPLVTFVARKVRQWPPDTGTSASGLECRNDEVLAETIRLFTSVRYAGLAYLEAKRDTRTGAHLVIEPNIGRPTGRSAIAEAGGVELLWTMYCDVTGRMLPTERVQRYGGAKWLDLRRDLQSAFHDWRRGRLAPIDWWRWVRSGPVFHAVWSREDPWPFFLDLLHTVRKVVIRGVARAPVRSRQRGGEAESSQSPVSNDPVD